METMCPDCGMVIEGPCSHPDCYKRERLRDEAASVHEAARLRDEAASVHEAAMNVLNSIRDATVEAAISIVRSEAELPGEMPDIVRLALEGKSKEEIMRLAVRATKASIAARLSVLKSTNEKIAVKVHSS